MPKALLDPKRVLRGKSKAASAAIALAAVVLLGVAQQHAPRRAVLTFWDGAAADEPGYAEEAANQIEDGTYAAHVGWWERPGYWNNRAVSDQGESEMDARMFSDAASRKNWETAGTDFWDTNSLYSESEDSDVDQDMMGTEFANSWPGTGANIYDWQDMAEDSDGYDGQWQMSSGDMEATDDAAVSQNDLAGFKAVGGARTQTLVECDACDSGSDCVSGCRVGGARLGQQKHRASSQGWLYFRKSARAAHRAALKDEEQLRKLRRHGRVASQELAKVNGINAGPTREAEAAAAKDKKEMSKLKKDDDEMADLEKILHPKNRFEVNRLVDKVLASPARKQERHSASPARRQMKRLSVLSGNEDSDEGEEGGGDEEDAQEPGKGWFLGCDPGPGFSKCLRESIRQTSQELTPDVRPFENKRQQNPGCAPGPGFSACMVENLDLDQPNYQGDGYWPVTNDASTQGLEDEGMNVDKWWDTKADAGASLFTFTPRRESRSAEAGYAMKGVKTQSLRFVPGVGLVEAHARRRAPQRAATPARAAAASAAVVKAEKTGDEDKALSAADGALAAARRQLGRERSQHQRFLAAQHTRALKLALLRKLQGKKVVEALDAGKAVSKKQQEALLVQELRRQQDDKNFKASGYLPVNGNVKHLRRMGVNVNGQQLDFDMNFKRKGYWPVNGNRHQLERLGVRVRAPSPAPRLSAAGTRGASVGSRQPVACCAHAACAAAHGGRWLRMTVR